MMLEHHLLNIKLNSYITKSKSKYKYKSNF